MAYEIIDKKLIAKVPYQYSRGYSQTTGYYYISEGDRGEIYTVFITMSREDAEDEMLKVLAHDIGYQCILKNANEIEIEHRKNWRYYSVIDRIENNRAISHDVENSKWKYNTKYDYRKYWFEFTLYVIYFKRNSFIKSISRRNYQI